MMRKLSPSKKTVPFGHCFFYASAIHGPPLQSPASYFIVLNSRPQRIAAIQLIGLYQTTLSSCE